MPEQGIELTPSQEMLQPDETVRLIKIFSDLGVSKVRFTGGEPLIRRDLPEIISQTNSFKSINNISITTNGVTLSRKLPSLLSSGLTKVNISLDTLVSAKYDFITRRFNAHERVLRAIDDCLSSDLEEVKVNCVVMKGFNEDEVIDFVEFTKERDLEVRFIEFMPFDENQWNRNKFFAYESMLQGIKEQHPEIYQLEGSQSDVSKVYQIPSYAGRIGFITSMSQNFCGGCNRIRLTADGCLKVCLFDNRELSLRDLMRSGASDEELIEVIGGGVKMKKFSH